MPKIITHSSQVAAQGRLNVRRAQASDFGGGAGLIQAGKDLGAFAEQMKIKEEKASNIQADKAYADAREHWMMDMKRRKDEAEGRAEGFVETTKSDFEEWQRQQLSESNLTPTAKARYAQNLNNLKISLMGEGIAFSSARSAAIDKVEVNEAVGKHINLAGVSRAEYDKSITEVRGIIDRSPLGDDVKAKLLQDAEDKAGEAYFLGEIERNPQLALSELGDEAWAGKLAAGKVQSLRKSARAEIKRRQTEAKAAARVAAVDASKGMSVVYDAMALHGHVSKDQLDELQKKVNASGEDSPILQQQLDFLRTIALPAIENVRKIPSKELGEFVTEMDAELQASGGRWTEGELALSKTLHKLMGGRQASAQELFTDLNKIVADAKAEGKQVSDKIISQMLEAAEATGDPLVIDAAKAVEAGKATTEMLKELTAGEVAGYANALSAVMERDGAPSREDVARLEAAKDVLDQRREMARTGKGWVENAATVLSEPVDPVDISDAASITKRAYIIQRMDDHLNAGGNYGDPYTPEERAKFDGYVRDEDWDNVNLVLRQLATGLGPMKDKKLISSFASSLAKDTDSPIVTAVVAQANGNTKLFDAIMRGYAAEKEGVKYQTTLVNSLTAQMTQYDTLIGAAVSRGGGKSFREAIKLAYLGQAKGEDVAVDEDTLNNIMDTAFGAHTKVVDGKEVKFGGVAEIGGAPLFVSGRKVVLPQNMSAEDFDKVYRVNLTDEMMEKFSTSGGRPMAGDVVVSADNLRQSSGFVTQYAPVWVGGGDYAYLDSDGNRLTDSKTGGTYLLNIGGISEAFNGR